MGVGEHHGRARQLGHRPGPPAARYSRNLKPRDGGSHQPRFDWEAEAPRPLLVHVFRIEGGCEHIIVRARLEVELAGEDLAVHLRDRHVEQAKGSALFEIGAALKRLVSRAVDRSRRAAARTRVEVGGRSLESTLRRVELSAEALDFSFAIRRATEEAL